MSYDNQDEGGDLRQRYQGGHPAPFDLALDGSITLERDSRDLLELEFILLFELLQRLTSHADELATR